MWSCRLLLFFSSVRQIVSLFLAMGSCLFSFGVIAELLLAVCTTCPIFHTKLCKYQISEKNRNRRLRMDEKKGRKKHRTERDMLSFLCYVWCFRLLPQQFQLCHLILCWCEHIIRMELNTHQDNKRTLFYFSNSNSNKKKTTKRTQHQLLVYLYADFVLLLCFFFHLWSIHRLTM